MICNLVRASWSAELVVGHDSHVVERSPSLADALPNGVVGEPLRGEAVLAAEVAAAAAESLVAADLAAPVAAEVVHGGVGAHPAAAAEQSAGDAVLLTSGEPASVATPQCLAHQDMLDITRHSSTQPLSNKHNKIY